MKNNEYPVPETYENEPVAVAADEPMPEEDAVGEGVLKLRKPFLLDGVEVRELPYDFDALTAKDIIEVDKERGKNGGNQVYVDIVDPASQLGIFARAVEKKLPTCTLNDLLRLKGRDAKAAMVLGRRFFTETYGDGEEGTSEKP